jgi:copper chaperone NosL
MNTIRKPKSDPNNLGTPGQRRARQQGVRPAGARLLTRAALSMAIFLAACGQRGLLPAELLPEDMCAHCKMAISEKRFAAEFITRDGEAFKFDDIGCMANFIKAGSNRKNIAGFFVMDYETRQWLPGETAHYVRSATFKTPMSGGIAAFKDKAKADQQGGQALTLDEILRR